MSKLKVTNYTEACSSKECDFPCGCECMYISKQIFIGVSLYTELLLNSNMAQQKYLLKFQKNTFKNTL